MADDVTGHRFVVHRSVIEQILARAPEESHFVFSMEKINEMPSFAMAPSREFPNINKPLED